MAHVTRIKAGDKKSDDEPKKTSTSKNIKSTKKAKGKKEVVKTTEKVVKKEKTTKKSTKEVEKKEKKPLPMPLRIVTAPFRWIAKPFIALGRYIRDSWSEIRQVKWPNRKATWGLVGSIFIYAAFFIILVMLLDALFNFIFSKIIG